MQNHGRDVDSPILVSDQRVKIHSLLLDGQQAANHNISSNLSGGFSPERNYYQRVKVETV